MADAPELADAPDLANDVPDPANDAPNLVDDAPDLADAPNLAVQVDVSCTTVAEAQKKTAAWRALCRELLPLVRTPHEALRTPSGERGDVSPCPRLF